MISEDVLGYHIEFYSNTLRRETVSTCYNCDGCGELHDFWQRFGIAHWIPHRHILQRNRFTYFNCDWCGKNTITDSFLGEHIGFQRDQSKESTCILLIESPCPLLAPCVTFLPPSNTHHSLICECQQGDKLGDRWGGQRGNCQGGRRGGQLYGRLGG